MYIVDNFLKNEKFIEKIEQDKDFWEVGYRWWSGWWSNPSKDNRKKLIEEIWCNNCPLPYRGMVLDGFEHWVGVHKPGENIETIGKEKFSLGPHVDKDEGLWESGKKVSNPLIGTIYYIKAPEEGGYLKIWEKEQDGPFQLIKPVVDRLVIFNAGKLHGIQEVLKGERKAIAINLWLHKPTTKMTEVN